MVEPTIICPKCKAEIKLTESLAAPFLESMRHEYEERLSKKALEIDERLREERIKIAEDEARKAKLVLGTDIDQKIKEISDLQEIIKQRDEKLAEAQKTQAEYSRKQRELDDAKRELDLNIEKRVQEELTNVRVQAQKEAEDQLKLKVKEKEETIASMQKQIADLTRRAQQGSQQLQGEVLELELEGILRSQFPSDRIEPVPKGEHGGDIVHRVIGPLGQACGTILWECKRTKNWSDGWLEKLREDQLSAKAEVAAIVSQTLPKEVETFALINQVWVTHPRTALPLAMALRQALIDVTCARQTVEGQQTKMGIIYEYLTGPRFRQRLEAIAESFSSMRDDLFKEKKVITKQWAKREAQIDRIMTASIGMYGDLQGIAGKTLKEIEGFELPALVEQTYIDKEEEEVEE
jgi:hypothetical protein